MTDQIFDPTFASASRLRAPEARSLRPTAVFWLAMFVASALGTNVGDFWADNLGLGLPTSFASLAIICGLFIWGDRENGPRTELFYWLAIIALRAVATNVGDFLTHAVGLNYLFAAIAIGALTLVCGIVTRMAPGDASPKIDLRYWATMFAGGVFGTIAGDLVAHTIGLFLAALVLGALLLAVIRIRNLAAPTAVIGYWCVVLAERAAATPMGDWVAKARGLGLGLPFSMGLICLLLIAILAWRAERRPAAGEKRDALPMVAILVPSARLALLVLSAAGSLFMLRIYMVEHPGNPSLVLAYGLGLAGNTLYLGLQEFTAWTSSGLGRLAAVWWAMKRAESHTWFEARETALRLRMREDGRSAAGRD